MQNQIDQNLDKNQFDLNEEEKALFAKSAEAVHKTNAALNA